MGPTVKSDPSFKTKRILSKDPKRMTPEEKEIARKELAAQLKAMDEKLEMAKAADPFWFYEPSDGKLSEIGKAMITEFLRPEDIPAQLDGALHVHLSKASIVGVLGGNQSGKTLSGTINDLIKACREAPNSLQGKVDHRIPKKLFNKIRVVCEDYTHGILNHNLPTLRRWIPREYLIDGRFEKSWSDKRSTVTLVHPKEKRICAEIEIMSNQADVETFQGPPIDRVRYDEEPRHDIHRENLARFTTSDKLDVEFDMTPTNGLSWVHEELFSDEIDMNGQSIEWFKLCSATNPKANLNVLREICRGLPSYEERKMRLLGEWISLSGLVYGGIFKRRTHVIQPEDIGLKQGQYLECNCSHVLSDSTVNANEVYHLPGCPFLKWIVFVGLDPHEVKPTAAAFLALSRDGDHIVDRCYLGEKTMPNIGMDINRILRLCRYGFTRCDPHADSEKTAFDNRNMWTELSRGPNRIPKLKKGDAYKGSILAGVDIIKQLLEVNKISGKPQLLIVDRPENQLLISSFRTLQRDVYSNEDVRGKKDAIREGKHDHHAALRYILQSKLFWHPYEMSTPTFSMPDLEAMY